jgi:hypothetical protein
MAVQFPHQALTLISSAPDHHPCGWNLSFPWDFSWRNCTCYFGKRTFLQCFLSCQQLLSWLFVYGEWTFLAFSCFTFIFICYLKAFYGNKMQLLNWNLKFIMEASAASRGEFFSSFSVTSNKLVPKWSSKPCFPLKKNFLWVLGVTCFFVFETVSYYVSQVDLELTIFLPQPRKC